MEQAMDVLRRKGKVTGKGDNLKFAEDVNLVVRCTQCGMTMPVISAFVDKKGDTYCGQCAFAMESEQKRRSKLMKVV